MNLSCHECDKSIPADCATSDPAGRWIGVCPCGAVSIDYGGKVAAQVVQMVSRACFAANCWQMHKNVGREEYFGAPLFAMPGVELPIVPRVAFPRIEGASRKDARR
jgi:hypothetical protein